MRHYLYRRAIALSFLICCSLGIYAQSNTYDRTTIASPTAASLGKYVDCPVNMHTGIADISIPIYTIEAGKLQVPISISNHPSGLKVLEPSSWVGAGFALNAGGVITRTVRGAPDERNTSNIYNADHGFFSDTGYMRRFYNGLMQDWVGVAAGRHDGEPDLYTFNFLGYVGKFYFSDDQQPVIIADGNSQDLKIEARYLGNSSSIQVFKVTAPDGTKFLFGGEFLTADNVEITNPFTTVSGYQEGRVISTWYLTVIRSADNSQTINFNYTPESYSYYSITTPPIANTEGLGTADAKLIKNYVNGCRLSSIGFPNGTVTFVSGAVRTDLSGFNVKEMVDNYSNTEATALGAIQISNNDGFCKKFIFHTGYWMDNSTPLPTQLASFPINSDRRRLRLDSIKEWTCTDALPQPAIRFDYFTELVPRRLTFAQDYWGFYNGQTGNTKFAPTITETGTSTVIAGANRLPNWPYSRAAGLRRIYWPTGGNVEYVYEPHDVTVEVGSPTYVPTITMTIGYDGSNPGVKTTLMGSSGETFKFTLLNSSGGSFASLYVKNNATGEYPVYLLANNTTTSATSLERSLPPGSYTVTVTKDAMQNGSTSGNGATVYVEEFTGTSGPRDTLVGGMRIKQVISFDHLTNTSKYTEYSYRSNGGDRSSGVLFSRPVFAAIIRNDLIDQLGDWSPSGFTPSCSPEGCITCNNFTYFRSANSVQPMTTSQGEHIGYSTVWVAKPGNGFSIYNYYTGYPTGYVVPSLAVTSVDRSTCAYSVSNFPYKPDEYNYMRGKLQEESHFRADGKILRNLLYLHRYQTPTDSTRAFMASYVASRYLGTFYWMTRSKKFEEEIITTNFSRDNADYVSTSQILRFGSATHNRPTQETFVDSRGDSAKTISKYALDYQPDCSYVFTCDNAYRTDCNSCQATYSAAQVACGNSSNPGACYTNAFLNYQKCVDNARIIYSNCRLTRISGILSEYKGCFAGKYRTADSLLKPIYALEYVDINEQIEQVKFRAGKLVEAKFNLFKEMSDSFSVYPKELLLLPISRPSVAFTPSGVSGNALTKDSRYVREAGVALERGMVQQLSSDFEVPVSTIWDYNQTYRTAVATNATVDQIAFTSFEGPGKGNWVYAGTPQIDNSAPTGRRVYTFNGSNSITRSGLTSSRTYVLSYWSKNAAAYTISGTQGAPIKGTSSVNGWFYYEHRITGVTNLIIGGSGSIDELKMYPKEAQMVTYTYWPLVGMTSMTGADDYITRYGYDGLGRLVTVSDRDGKLVEVKDYQFQVPQIQ